MRLFVRMGLTLLMGAFLTRSKGDDPGDEDGDYVFDDCTGDPKPGLAPWELLPKLSSLRRVWIRVCNIVSRVREDTRL